MKSLTPILCVIAIIAGIGVFAAASTSVPGVYTPPAAYTPAADAPAAYTPASVASDQADGSTMYVEARPGLVGRAAGLIPGHSRRVARRDARHQASDVAESTTETTYVEAPAGIFGRAVGLIPGHARRAARRDARHQQ